MPVSVSQYLFGNSLVNYAEGGDLTNVPHWMDLFADTAGHTYEVAGGYGFLREFADAVEPPSLWGFAGVDASIEEGESFSSVELNSVLITPANFIQDNSPDTNYAFDTRSPLDAVIDTVQTALASQPGAQILIYEGWADMAPFDSSGSPDAAALAAYHDYNMGAYHDWYVTLVEQVNAALPEADVQLLPIASILSDLLTTTLSDIPADELYVDDAPHGTETVYFLSAMITYQANYGEPAPLPASLPDEIHPSVFEHFDEINDVIEAGLAETGVDQAGDEVVVPGDPDPIPDPEPEPAPEPEPQPEPEPEPEPAPEPEPDVDDSDDAEAPAPDAPVEPVAPELPAGDREPPDPVPEPPAPEPVQEQGSDQDEPDTAAPPAPPVGVFAANFFTLANADMALEEIDFAATPDATGTEDALNFVGEAGGIWDGGPSDQVAAQYLQTLESPEGGVYLFNMLADDQAQLFVDGTLVADTRDVPFETAQEITVELQPGDHEIEVLYVEHTGEASLQMSVNRIGDLPTSQEQAEETPTFQEQVDDTPTIQEQVVDLDDINAIFMALANNWNAMEAEAENNGRLEAEAEENDPLI
ncbi:PA14 domain-containing protein [Pacificoceanicola onchidii]|uniref:PA14 domain-containing protein n=1 Tax=Pacificoceanicola onchidii TaxID=2562685 RepID=UPI0010A3F463|nr:PA14 domain-containing protein [Pacificoceanicola onchidii]